MRTRGKTSLEQVYCGDSILKDLYLNKLLEPGYAGEINDTELAYIKTKLFNDRRLRAKWGFVRGTGRLSEEKIRKVALYGTDGFKKCPSEGFMASVQLRFPNERGPPLPILPLLSFQEGIGYEF